MNISLEGHTLFITGGHGGIGRAICERFSASGAEVIAPSSKEMNLLDESSISSYLASLGQPADIVIHCAGVNILAGIEEADPQTLSRVFQVNLFSFMAILKHFIPSMRSRHYGRIVGISSLYGIVSRERRIPYSSSKHAVSGLIKSLALETAGENILVNGAAPGYVMTEMTRKNLSQPEIEEITRNIPTGRFQKAEEIADLCCFLCSELNQSITGQIIPVDGGFLCK